MRGVRLRSLPLEISSCSAPFVTLATPSVTPEPQSSSAEPPLGTIVSETLLVFECVHGSPTFIMLSFLRQLNLQSIMFVLLTTQTTVLTVVTQINYRFLVIIFHIFTAIIRKRPCTSDTIKL